VFHSGLVSPLLAHRCVLENKLSLLFKLLQAITLVTRVGKIHFICILPLPTPVQCWPNTSLHFAIFQHWKGEWGCYMQHLFSRYSGYDFRFLRIFQHNLSMVVLQNVHPSLFKYYMTMCNHELYTTWRMLFACAQLICFLFSSSKTLHCSLMT